MHVVQLATTMETNHERELPKSIIVSHDDDTSSSLNDTVSPDADESSIAPELASNDDDDNAAAPDCISLSADEDVESKRLAEMDDTARAPASSVEQVASSHSDGDEQSASIELRFLVRRREAGALIGKRGANIKRLRETFRSSIFSIPDTGNGPERVVCIATNDKSLNGILADLAQLLLEKSPENDEQIELKLLIHSSHAGSIIGIGGQSIKKLRNDSKAAIKIYEMCCPLSSERVCAIKARPPVVVSTIKMILSILNENQIKGTMKAYDALHFDPNLVDKYGGYLPDDAMELLTATAARGHHHYEPIQFNRQVHDANRYLMKNYSLWRSPECRNSRQPEPCEPSTSDITAENEEQLSPKRNQDSGGQEPQKSQKPHQHRENVRYHPYQPMIAQLAALVKPASPSPRHHLPHHHHYHHHHQAADEPLVVPAMHYVPRMHLPTMQQRPIYQSHFTEPAADMPFHQSVQRCRHERGACLCMYLPTIVPMQATGSLQASPYLFSRNSAHGYNKQKK